MADKDLTQGQQLNASDMTRYTEIASGVYARTVAVAGIDTTGDAVPVTYAALHTATAGNGAPAVVVPANASRRALIVTNVSDVAIYLSIGSGTNLSTTVFTFKLDVNDSLIFSDPVTTQAIYADAGAAAKNIAYQEAI